MTKSIELIPLVCLRCQTPVPAEPEEVAWVCAQCGQGLLLSEEKGTVPQVVNYAAGIIPNNKGKPFWVVTAQVALQRRTFGIGDQNQEAARAWSVPRRFFVPAFTLPLEQLVEWGTRLLVQPPNLQAGSPASFLPVTLLPEDIKPMVEFIVMGVEANRKDKLKEVQISLQLGAPELWILP